MPDSTFPDNGNAYSHVINANRANGGRVRECAPESKPQAGLEKNRRFSVGKCRRESNPVSLNRDISPRSEAHWSLLYLTSIGTAVATFSTVRTGAPDYATRYLVAAAASVAVLAVYGFTVRRAKRRVALRRRWGADSRKCLRQPIQASKRRFPISVPPKSGMADRWLARAVNDLVPIEWRLRE